MKITTLNEWILDEATRNPGCKIEAVYDRDNPERVTMYGQDATSTFRLVDGQWLETTRLAFDDEEDSDDETSTVDAAGMRLHMRTTWDHGGTLRHTVEAFDEAPIERLTKYDIVMRQAQAIGAAQRRIAEDVAHFDQPCGLPCSGCGKWLETEGDFARHYTVPDPRLSNIGTCDRPRVEDRPAMAYEHGTE